MPYSAGLQDRTQPRMARSTLSQRRWFRRRHPVSRYPARRPRTMEPSPHSIASRKCPTAMKKAITNSGVISAVRPNKFVAGFPITVVARAAEVWITKLDDDTADNALVPHGTRAGSGPLKGAWKQTSYGPAVNSAEQEAPSDCNPIVCTLAVRVITGTRHMVGPEKDRSPRRGDGGPLHQAVPVPACREVRPAGPRSAGRCHDRAAEEPEPEGQRRSRREPGNTGGLHLSRTVHRPRPHLRPHFPPA